MGSSNSCSRDEQLSRERVANESNAHALRMKNLENADKEVRRADKKAQVKRIQGILDKLEEQINDDQKAKTIAEESITRNGESIKKVKTDIDNFGAKRAKELEKVATTEGLDAAKKAFDDRMKEIQSTVKSTGQTEENVGQFLELTLSLVGATMDTTAQTNKLDIALATFGKILNDECQDKLTVESYFNEMNLARFIPFLAQEGYTVLDDLKCDDNDGFEKDILSLCEKAVTEEEKSDEKAEEKKELDGEDLCKDLLSKWKLTQYWEKLEEDGWDDANDWTDLAEDDLTEIIPKKGHRNKFMKMCKKRAGGGSEYETALKQQEVKRLEQICLKPESWSVIQDQKIGQTKEGLLSLSPVLAQFFGRMNDAVLQIGEVMAYSKDLSDQQQSAIDMSAENDKKLKAIEYRKDDNVARGKWTKNSDVRIYSDSSKEWCPAQIIEIKRDSEGEWLNVQYEVNNETRTKQVQRYANNSIRPTTVDREEKKEPSTEITVIKEEQKDLVRVQKNNNKLIKASIVRISVTDTMIQEFSKNSLTKRGLTLAGGVESASMHIVRGQGQIRQSVLLGKTLLEYKPSNITDPKTVELWGAVDDGINQIFTSALEMVKVSAQYFAFFIRFQSSFQYFDSCYANGKDTHLMVSLDRLRKDVRDFNKFTANFTQTIDDLSSTSMKCIGNCVKAQIGAKQWESSRAALVTTKAAYLKAKGKYDEADTKLDVELDRLKQDRIRYETTKTGAESKLGLLKQRLQQNNEYIQKCKEAMADLNKVVI